MCLCKPHVQASQASLRNPAAASQREAISKPVGSTGCMAGSKRAVRGDRPPVGVDRRRGGWGGRVGEAEDEAGGRAVVVVMVGDREGAQGTVLAAAGADGDVAHGAAGGPVALAVLAEVARLVDVVVVEVAELGVHAAAPRAWQDLVRLLQLHLLLLLLMARRLAARLRRALAVDDLRPRGGVGDGDSGGFLDVGFG